MSPEEQAADEWAPYRLLGQMWRQLSWKVEHRLALASGISAADYDVLYLLLSVPGGRLRAGEMAQMLAWEKSRLSHQISRMQKRELVERSHDADDGRGTWIRLSTAGRELIAAAQDDHHRAVRELFLDHLDERERRLLIEVSGRLASRINPEAAAVARTYGRPFR